VRRSEDARVHVRGGIRGLGRPGAGGRAADVAEEDVRGPERDPGPLPRGGPPAARDGPGRRAGENLLEILSNAESNADYEGLDTGALYVRVASCARGKIRPGSMPRAQGRATEWNEQTTNVEIVLAERKEG